MRTQKKDIPSALFGKTRLGILALIFSAPDDAFRKKRNMNDYDTAGCVSEMESEEMIKLAHKLRKEVEIWLYSKHPKIMEKH